MLERIGTDSLDELYNDVPEKFLYKGEYDLRDSMSEQEVREYFECLDKKSCCSLYNFSFRISDCLYSLSGGNFTGYAQIYF